jgi:hypothetical protein
MDDAHSVRVMELLAARHIATIRNHIKAAVSAAHLCTI